MRPLPQALLPARRASGRRLPVGLRGAGARREGIGPALRERTLRRRSRTRPPTTTTTGGSGGTSAGNGGPRAARRSACSTAGCTPPTARRRARRSSSRWWTRWERARCFVSAMSGTRDPVRRQGRPAERCGRPSDSRSSRRATPIPCGSGSESRMCRPPGWAPRGSAGTSSRCAAAGGSRAGSAGEAVADSGVGFFETFVGRERARGGEGGRGGSLGARPASPSLSRLSRPSPYLDAWTRDRAGRELIDTLGRGWTQSRRGSDHVGIRARPGVHRDAVFQPRSRGRRPSEAYWREVPYHQAEIAFTSGEIYAAGPWFSTEFKCVFRRRRTGEWVDARGAIFCETADLKISEMRMYWHRWSGGRETSKP